MMTEDEIRAAIKYHREQFLYYTQGAVRAAEVASWAAQERLIQTAAQHAAILTALKAELAGQ